MSMFPTINTDLQTQINNINQTVPPIDNVGKTYLFDFTTGDFALSDGKLVIASELEALKNWIIMTVKTEKFKFKIYQKEDTTQEYGVTLIDLLVGNNYQNSYIKSEIKREIEEALIKHILIKSVDNFTFTRNKKMLVVSFTVNLKDDSTLESEVSLIV